VADIPDNPAGQDPSENLGASGESSFELDTRRLNEIMLTALKPGMLFSRGLELTDYDRDQFQRVAAIIENRLAPHFKHPAWKKFEDLYEEGSSKGILLSFDTHEGTNVPMWCVDGGDDPVVKKVMRESEHGRAAGIQVPHGIFNLYHWQITTEQLKGYITTPNDLLKHRSTHPLGRDLNQLVNFVSHSGHKD
jgi:hypothetical protein